MISLSNICVDSETFKLYFAQFFGRVCEKLACFCVIYGICMEAVGERKKWKICTTISQSFDKAETIIYSNQGK